MSSVIGIDVSKKTLECALASGKRRSLTNDAAGHARLLSLCAEGTLAVMEATGRHHERLADFLVGKGREVAVVNPARSRHFALGRGGRNKTDAADAESLRQMGERLDLVRYTPPSPALKEIRSLSRHRQCLAERLAAIETRLKEPDPAELEKRHLEGERALLRAQIREVDRETDRLIQADPELRRRRELLLGLPGFGPVISALFLCEMPEGLPSAKQAAAYAGVCPRQVSSGTSVRGAPRLSKRGNARLRRGLYLAALTAVRAEGPVKELYLRRVAGGMVPMQAMGVVMHRLCRLAHAVLKSGEEYDPDYGKEKEEPPTPEAALDNP